MPLATSIVCLLIVLPSGPRGLATGSPRGEAKSAAATAGNGLIAFTTTRDGNSEVYVMNADGSAQVDLTNNAATDSQPAWSPDGGTRIAFTTTRDGNSEVYVMNADGSAQVDLTNDPGSDSQPAWSPDGGTRIAFSQRRKGNDEIDLMDSLDGSDQIDITHNGATDLWPRWQALPAGAASGWPIRHIVILYQENHSFDNVLGLLCTLEARCDGATTGELPDGTVIPLSRASDIVPSMGHGGNDQVKAINDGMMNGFADISGCGVGAGYACYSQFDQSQIPNLWSLAQTFTISDRTFEQDAVPSWQAHLELAAADLDGFDKNANPSPIPGSGSGWGCDSQKDALWRPTIWDALVRTPSCVPDVDGSGPYRPSAVPWVPTIMDRLDAAGLPWRIYAASADRPLSYGWAICPTFADCLYTDQERNVLPPSQFGPDAQAGRLPSLSIVLPTAHSSQHNLYSMLEGDNWISESVESVMNGPQWGSTAIFIAYDDCGCFYDHVPPPAGLGIRVPMVIVSAYARPGYTDSNTASFDSLLAFVEQAFRLAPLSPRDAAAYDYSGAFDFGQRPLPPIRLHVHPMASWEQRWINEHPPDPDDPT